jgi:hypothetical protein
VQHQFRSTQKPNTVIRHAGIRCAEQRTPLPFGFSAILVISTEAPKARSGEIRFPKNSQNNQNCS